MDPQAAPQTPAIPAPETGGTPEAAGTPATAALLARLEALSQARPDRVLRLRGTLPLPEEPNQPAPEAAGVAGAGEAFELVIFRGFSSSTTHPTAFDPDVPALEEGARITAAELLQGPLRPGAEQRLTGPLAVEPFLEPEGWQ